MSHRKTRKLRRIQRKPRREGTSHWQSSSRIAWTRTVRPARGVTEEENERVRPVQATWVEAGQSWSSRITSVQRITAAVAGVNLTDARICLCKLYHQRIRHGQSRPWTGSPPSGVHNLLHLSGVHKNWLKGTFYSSSRLVKLDTVRTASSGN